MAQGDVIPSELLGQANELVSEFKRVSCLLPGAGRPPDVANVRKMSVCFAHREQSYQKQLKRLLLRVGVPLGLKGLVAGEVGGAAGETVKEKLDQVIANRQELIASAEETNRLLRSLERIGERLLPASGVARGDDDVDAIADDGGDADMEG
ncbi:MAG: hypothetical protein M1816_004010 [Peltula sp. TS41687]|nr:MAG: hypothetical protein M1816_004010 [Peltula sp. TS41687]